MIVLVYRYPPSAWRLILSVYDRKFSASIQQTKAEKTAKQKLQNTDKPANTKKTQQKNTETSILTENNIQAPNQIIQKKHYHKNIKKQRTPNNVPMNMIGLSQTSRKILEDGDVPIFPVVISNLDHSKPSLNHYCDCTGILLSTFYVEVNTICI